MTDIGVPAISPPKPRWGVEPARAIPTPCRERLERALFRRGWRITWDRWDSADGFVTLALTLHDGQMRSIRRVAFTKKAGYFDEGKAAEGAAEWIMDPHPTPN